MVEPRIDACFVAVKPYALYIVAHAPSRTARQAGQKTAQLYLEELRKQYQVDTIVLCSATDHELQTMSNCDPAIYSLAFGRWRKMGSILTGGLMGVPPRFATRIASPIKIRIKELLEEKSYELVWFEFSQVCWLLPWILRFNRNLKTVLSLHDIQGELVSRKSWLERVLFETWTRAYERKLLKKAGLIRVQSSKDRDLVQLLVGPGSVVEVVPPAMSSFVQSVIRRSDQVQPNSLLFWGAMNRSENYSAALSFAKIIFPQIAARFQGAVLYIVGSNPPPQLRAIASDQIIVTGFVEDPTSYFARASLGVAPLTDGAGIKVKTLEMLAAGLTVVSTPIGAEGIPSTQRLIVTDIQDMADAIVCLWSAGHTPQPQDSC